MKNADFEAWLQQRNIGPAIAELLVSADIKVEDLKTSSVEDLLIRVFSHHQKPGLVHSGYLYALHGAKYNCDWSAVPKEDKDRYKQFTKEFRASWKR